MTKKITQIEFFRLLFMLIIMYGHLMRQFIFPYFNDMPIFAELQKHTSPAFGYLCEAFFVISGFFLAQAFSSGKFADFGSFFVTRFARLAPVVWFDFCVRALFRIIGWTKFSFYGNLTVIFFIPNALSVKIPSELNWFVGSLFWGSAIYYLLWKVVDIKKFYYIVAIITLCTYCILLNKIHFFNDPKVWNDVFPFLLLRAVAGLGLGLLFGAYFLNSKPSETDRVQKIIWSFIDFALLVIIVNLAIITWSVSALPTIMTCFVILFYSFLFKKSYISKIVGCKYVVWAAKYSYSAYIMHPIVLTVLYHTLHHHPVWGVRQYPVGNIVFSLCAAYLVSIVVYHLIESPIRKLILSKFSARQAQQQA